MEHEQPTQRRLLMHSLMQVVNPSMLGAILNIRMVTWKYLNFQVKVRLNSRVFAIEEKIRQHHGGSVHDVFLYNGVVAPDNLLNDPSATLHDAGFEGGIDGEEPEQDVWYDFSPLQTSCPLLMATPNDREQRESPYRSASRLANERRSPSPKRGSIVSYGTTGAGATPVLAKRGSVASMDPSSPVAGSPTVASMVSLRDPSAAVSSA
jgi:hypothetical protein